MKLETAYFGEVNIEEYQIIHFDQGIPGFEEKKSFVLLNNYDTEDPVPFMWLQSTEDSNLAFVVTIPFFMRPDYEFELPNDIANSIGLTSQDQVGVYTICKISGHVDSMSFNLRSPIIINAENKKAVQLVLPDTRYTAREMFVK